MKMSPMKVLRKVSIFPERFLFIFGRTPCDMALMRRRVQEGGLIFKDGPSSDTGKKAKVEGHLHARKWSS